MAAAATAKKTKTEAAPKPPEGFRDEGMPDLDAFVDLQACSRSKTPVQGRIVGHLRIKNKAGGMRDVVMVKTRAECFGKNKGDNEPTKFPAGSVLGLSITHKLRPVLNYVEKRGAVWLMPLNKVEIGSGRTVWNLDGPYCKGEKAELVIERAATRDGAADDIDDIDDIPF